MPRASRRNNSHASSRSVSPDPEIEKEFLPTAARIPKTKWREIAEGDNVSQIVDYILEEIFRSAADTIYEGYLRRAVYGFVTDCVYEAWMRAFRWVHLEYDNREMSPASSDCRISDEEASDKKDPRPRRGVPTVYGRLEKLIAVRKSPSYCRVTHAADVTRRKIKQLSAKTPQMVTSRRSRGLIKNH